VSKQHAKNNLIKLLTDDINNPGEDKHNDMVSLELLIPYANHPFKLYEGDRLADMVRSIKEMGVLLPIIVRPVDSGDGRYEILSGHNRVNAAKEAGLTEVPAIIKPDLSDEDAKLIVTETNLVQRSFTDLSYSEKAVALKHHMEAISSQGKRNDIIDEINTLLNAGITEETSTSYQIDTKLRSNAKTGGQYGLSSASVARHIRISYLIAPLQERVDNDEIGFIPAVSISYLAAGEQEKLNKILEGSAYKIDMKKAGLLRGCSENKKLTDDVIIQILSGEFNKKPKTKTPPPLKIKYKIYSKYFGEAVKLSEMEEIIDKALEEYFAK
jgi:ParB family chromosome partitioning protein